MGLFQMGRTAAWKENHYNLDLNFRGALASSPSNGHGHFKMGVGVGWMPMTQSIYPLSPSIKVLLSEACHDAFQLSTDRLLCAILLCDAAEELQKALAVGTFYLNVIVWEHGKWSKEVFNSKTMIFLWFKLKFIHKRWHRRALPGKFGETNTNINGIIFKTNSKKTN